MSNCLVSVISPDSKARCSLQNRLGSTGRLAGAFGLAVVGLANCTGLANAQDRSYHITEAEKAACTPDAQRFCSAAYPDEGKLLTCMTANQQSLSAGCAIVFKAGKKERGLR